MTEIPTGTGAVLSRISDADQQDPARQNAMLAEWLDRRGIRGNVPAPFWIEDDGSRDLMEARSGFAKIMKLVRLEAIHWVLVPEADRFGMKNWKHLGKYLVEMEEHGVDLWSCDKGKLSGDDFGKDCEMFFGGFKSKEEQRSIGRRVLSDKRHRFKSSYQGGHIPFGFDVLCLGVDGQEKWRLLHRGRNKVKIFDHERDKWRFVYLQKRVKQYPDGREERFDDHVLDVKPYVFHNNPSRDKTDVLVINITRDQKLIDAVRAIRTTFAEQAISFHVLGRMLAKMAPSYYLPAFTPSTVRNILEDDIYIGVDYSGKKSFGKYARYNNGQIAPPPEVRGKVVRGVKNPREDWIAQEYEITPIFDMNDPADRAIVEKCKAKLAAITKRKPNAPKSERVWLSGLLVCGKCGEPMRGFHMQRDDERYSAGRRDYPHYLCSKWDHDPSACDRNTIHADLIEAIIRRYVEDTGAQLALLSDANHPASKEILMPIIAELKTLQSKKDRLAAQMAEFVRPLRTDSEAMRRAIDHFEAMETRPVCHTPQSAYWGAPLIEFYRFFFNDQAPIIEETIAKKQAKMHALIEKGAGLEGRALRENTIMANKLGEEIDALEKQQVNLADEAERIGEELASKIEAFHRLRDNLRETGGYRRARQDLEELVGSITCEFAPTGKRKPKTKLVKVTIEGKDGSVWSCDPAQYRDEISPRRSCDSPARECRRRACAGTRMPRG
jgi:hypothetical protein